jgi:uridine phosphorylase
MTAFQERGARAVEMELSALFSVAAFHAFEDGRRFGRVG